MNGFLAIAWRDVRLAWTGGGLWLPIVFYLAVATLFPFAAGPDKALLARVGGSILWIAALLASLLPIERLVLPDRQAGVLDQLYLRGWADEWIAAAKIAGHITGFGLPLLLTTPIAIALLGVPDARITEALGEAREVEALREGLCAGHSVGERNEVEDGERGLHGGCADRTAC